MNKHNIPPICIVPSAAPPKPAAANIRVYLYPNLEAAPDRVLPLPSAPRSQECQGARGAECGPGQVAVGGSPLEQVSGLKSLRRRVAAAECDRLLGRPFVYRTIWPILAAADGR